MPLTFSEVRELQSVISLSNSKQEVLAIETEQLGKLWGRDCIFLDLFSQENNTLTLKGEIERYEDTLVDYKYTLIFKSVIAYFTCELDTYEHIDNSYVSSFNIVKNSEWLSSLPVRSDIDRLDLKHFQVFTYDYVLNIIAKSYDFKVEK